MPQEIPSDDLGVLQIPEKIHREKVLCRDLATYLGVWVGVVNKWAKERKCAHVVRRTPNSEGLVYVSPLIAARIIIYFRAKQELAEQKKRPRKG